jgi:type II secretory pathway component PulJ
MIFLPDVELFDMRLCNFFRSNTALTEEISRQQTQRLEEIEYRTTQLDENLHRLVQAITGPRTHHPVLTLPSLVLPRRQPQAAYLPITNWNQVMDGASLTL